MWTIINILIGRHKIDMNINLELGEKCINKGKWE